jgi:hypothetical protein
MAPALTVDVADFSAGRPLGYHFTIRIRRVWLFVMPLTTQGTEEGDDVAIVSIHSLLDYHVLAPVFAKYVYGVLRMFPISLTS